MAGSLIIESSKQKTEKMIMQTLHPVFSIFQSELTHVLYSIVQTTLLAHCPKMKMHPSLWLPRLGRSFLTG